MEGYRERVAQEKQELDTKRGELLDFTTSDQFLSLPGTDRQLLEKQLRIMGRLSDVLSERLDRMIIVNTSSLRDIP